MAGEEATPTQDAPPPPKKRLPMTLGIVAAVAVLQGVGFFIVFKFVGGRPDAAHGETSHVIEGAATSQPVTLAEVALIKSFKVPNDKTGRMWLYDMDVAVVVRADLKERMEKLAAERAGEIADCVARIVRGATERMLKEDDLRVLRTQLVQGFNEITQDEQLIQRVLIPRFVPLPL